MEVRKSYADASERTVDELRTIAHSLDMRDLSELTLPQIEEMAELVGRVSPAGDVSGVIRQGLARIPIYREPTADEDPESKPYLRSMGRVLDKAIFGTFFVGPATLLWGYQRLLLMAGKEIDEAFPEGYWQFYLNYALREDTARHANETHGFDTVLKRHQIHLSPTDRMTAWVMASIHCLHMYHDLLRNEWRERIYTSALAQITANRKDAARFARLYRQWERQRPYRRGPDVKPGQDYPTYRQHKFDEFLEKAMHFLPDRLRQEWVFAVTSAKECELPLYQQQMSILAYLESGFHGEKRVPIPLEQAHIGLISRGRYYLIPACRPGTSSPADVTMVRAQIAAILKEERANLTVDSLVKWATVRRKHVHKIRQQMRPELLEEIDKLRYTPILLNMDQQPYYLELSELRQAERGTGSHAMTIFNTGQSFVFDLSHIFFDGTWGAALAEIMTNEATAWGVYLNSLPAIHPPTTTPHVLKFAFTDREQALLEGSPKVSREVSAETESINLRNLLALRRIFKLRSDLIQLTVNDLLVLYRAIHALKYRPDPGLVAEIETLLLDEKTRPAAESALSLLDVKNATNPAILIPVDASQRDPRDRLQPMTFQVPIYELNLLELHDHVVEALNDYKTAAFNRDEAYQEFDQLQRRYLAALAGCGDVFNRAKEIAAMGESSSVGTIKLLAHLPVSFQRLLDKIPSQFDILNDLIKGREVFSNIGAVASSSSLTRFMSAKDDNDNKTLAWGVLTDAENMMRITLRDFRPHVSELAAVGRIDLAIKIIQDYLNAYASGLNDFIRDLRRVTMASRETRMASDIGMLDARESSEQ